jgi:protein TonB
MGRLVSTVLTGLFVASALVAAPAAAQSDSWSRQVQALVKANYSYPRSAEIRGEQGKAVIRITLSPDGKIGDVAVTQSSGSAILDREAVRIAQRIGQFPTPPRGTTSVVVPIVWQLN